MKTIYLPVSEFWKILDIFNRILLSLVEMKTGNEGNKVNGKGLFDTLFKNILLLKKCHLFIFKSRKLSLKSVIKLALSFAISKPIWFSNLKMRNNVLFYENLYPSLSSVIITSSIKTNTLCRQRLLTKYLKPRGATIIWTYI